MKLSELLDVAPHANLLVMADLDAGTTEKFDVTIMRGSRNEAWNPEFIDWLIALDLQVDRIDVCGKDTAGNKDMLCVFCKPIQVVRKGKWTLNNDGSGTCSECGRKQYNCWDADNWDNFCHFCGADMRPRPKEET